MRKKPEGANPANWLPYLQPLRDTLEKLPPGQEIINPHFSVPTSHCWTIKEIFTKQIIGGEIIRDARSDPKNKAILEQYARGAAAMDLIEEIEDIEAIDHIFLGTYLDTLLLETALTGGYDGESLTLLDILSALQEKKELARERFDKTFIYKPGGRAPQSLLKNADWFENFNEMIELSYIFMGPREAKKIPFYKGANEPWEASVEEITYRKGYVANIHLTKILEKSNGRMDQTLKNHSKYALFGLSRAIGAHLVKSGLGAHSVTAAGIIDWVNLFEEYNLEWVNEIANFSKGREQ